MRSTSEAEFKTCHESRHEAGFCIEYIFWFQICSKKSHCFTIYNTVENIVQSADDLRHFPTNSVVFI